MNTDAAPQSIIVGLAAAVTHIAHDDSLTGSLCNRNAGKRSRIVAIDRPATCPKCIDKSKGA